MNGKLLTEIIKNRLDEMGMSVAEFCQKIGISQSAFSQWKNGRMPKPERQQKIEEILGINLADYEPSSPEDEIAEMLEWIRSDFSHRALYETAKGLTPEQIFKLASFSERLKAGDFDGTAP